jgi:polar amino acid transport system substrate-binding protein
MKIFFKILGLVFAVIVAGPMQGAQAGLKFGVAAEAYPPFTSKDASGQWVGWEVDFMKALCADIGESCEITDVAWDGIIPALNAKTFDAILASMAITDKRKQVIDFSNMYYNSASVIVGAKGGAKDITPGALKGKRLGAQVSTTHAAYAAKHFASAGVDLKTYQTQDQANADLAAGRLDFVEADGIAMDAFLTGDSGTCCESLGAVPGDPEIFGQGVGLGLRKQEPDLAGKLNKGIADLAGNGTLDKITAAWKLTGKIILPAKK